MTFAEELSAIAKRDPTTDPKLWLEDLRKIALHGFVHHTKLTDDTKTAFLCKMDSIDNHTLDESDREKKRSLCSYFSR